MKHFTLTLSLILALTTSVNAIEIGKFPASVKYAYACAPFLILDFDGAALEKQKTETTPFWMMFLENGDYVFVEHSNSERIDHFQRLPDNQAKDYHYARDGSSLLIVRDAGTRLNVVKFESGVRKEVISRTTCAR